MKSPLIPWLGMIVAAVVAFFIGRATAPGIQATASTAVESKAQYSSDTPSSAAPPDGSEVIPPRLHSTPRRDVSRSNEPRVSLPFKSVVDLLKNDLQHQDFTSIGDDLDNAWVLLGLTPDETTRVKAVFSKATSDIAAAEKAHVKVAETTPEKLVLDLSAMAGPVSEIIAQTQHGIRAELPGDIAGGLLAAIDWERFYAGGESPHVTFEILRNKTGLTAWEKGPNGGMGSGVDSGFHDDGSALPAEQIYTDSRWKPFLQGVTLVPRDD